MVTNSSAFRFQKLFVHERHDIALLCWKCR